MQLYKGGLWTLQLEKKQKIEAHAEAMRLADLEINLLAVRAEKLRHVNGLEVDLKEIYQRHIELSLVSWRHPKKG